MILATMPRSLTLPITDNSRHSRLLTIARMCQIHPASRPSRSFFHLPGLCFPSSLPVWLPLNLHISPSWKATSWQSNSCSHLLPCPTPIILNYLTLFISFLEFITIHIHFKCMYLFIVFLLHCSITSTRAGILFILFSLTHSGPPSPMPGIQLILSIAPLKYVLNAHSVFPISTVTILVQATISFSLD